MQKYRGGTKVTVSGSHFDSVAEPRINLSVVTTSSWSTYTDIDTDSGV